jgi:hypothetical protein
MVTLSLLYKILHMRKYQELRFTSDLLMKLNHVALPLKQTTVVIVYLFNHKS